MSIDKKRIAIFGGGPSNLIAAEFLSRYFNVILYEKEKNIGQKFLVAGKGGFNLTNNLSRDNLLAKYSPNHFFKNAIYEFDSVSLRKWLAQLNIPTFVGTSQRVFPKEGIKPIQVLNNILERLKENNVKILTKHRFTSFNKNFLPQIIHNGNTSVVHADFYIFGLGGASWSTTGSDGAWLNAFKNVGIRTNFFQPSNCGINISWPQHIKKYHLGKPLKNISITIENKTFLGEAVVTDYGLEGNVIYQTISIIRELLNKNKKVIIKIDFKPFNSKEQLLKKILDKRYTSKDYSKILNINKLELSLIKEYTTKNNYTNKELFILSLKSLQIPVKSLRPIEEAISTVGGIDINELNNDFSLKKFPNVFTIGEMVDWDAPTGGFLLQGCFSMGYYAAKSIIKQTSFNN